MTQQAVEGFRTERANVLGVLRTLSPEEWESQSACAGWSVKDVATHLVASMQLVADPANATFPEPGQGMEAAMDSAVSRRRSLAAAEVVELYEETSAKAIDAFESLQADGVGDTELDMGDLGIHPTHYLPNAYAFDAFTHLRVDLLAPAGPLEREVEPPSEAVLAATSEWLVRGIAQMCTEALKPTITQPIELVLDGPGGGAWTLSPTDGDHACEISDGASGDAAARVTSTVPEFVSWSTKRSDWLNTATVTGDIDFAAKVLDAINLI